MLRLKKLIMLVLAALIVSFGVPGCKKKADHPGNQTSGQKAPSEEHPTDGNKPVDGNKPHEHPK